jgi:colicin import membrane protein
MSQVVDPQQYGIEPKKATELTGNLAQIKSEREPLIVQYDEVIKMDIDDPKTSKVASELRKRIKDNRTKGIEVWHKNTKDYFLKGGQFVDAIKRLEVDINTRMEDNLELIEKHQELKEKKRRDDLKAERLLELLEYKDFVPSGIDLGTMSDEEYQKIFNGAKLQFDAKVAEDLKAEEKRLEDQRLDSVEKDRRIEIAPYVQFLSHSPSLREMSDAEYQTLLKSLTEAKKQHDDEQEAIRLENLRLKEEAEAKEAELKAERERVAAELKAEQERVAEERRIAEEALKAEQEKAAKLEAEIKAKREAEEKAERDRLAKEKAEKEEAEKLAKGPIKEQLKSWIAQFELPKTSVDNEVSKEIIEKFESFRTWSVKVVDNL